MFQRIRNLWKLSEYRPDTSDELLSKDTLVLKRDIRPKPRPATIIETEDLPDMFPDHVETA